MIAIIIIIIIIIIILKEYIGRKKVHGTGS
jgi:hypothetical protein